MEDRVLPEKSYFYWISDAIRIRVRLLIERGKVEDFMPMVDLTRT